MLKRLKVLGVASLVACSLTLGGAGAFAADTDKAPWDNNAPATGSLMIKKLKDGETQGTETPVQGAEFTVTEVEKVNNQAFNLKTEQGWKTLAKQVDALNAGTVTPTLKADAKKMTTGQNGIAQFAGLAIGLYKVVESKVPAGYSSDVRPFYITIPQITKGANGLKNPVYTYGVTVKPKNKDVSSEITKTADTTKTVVAGDQISYEIEAGVNKSKESNGGVDLTKDDLKGYTIFDDAPNNTYTALPNGVKKVTVGQIELVKNTDYTIVANEATPGAADRTRLKVEFTDSGLEKIATAVNADPKARVKVQLTFTISANYAKDEIVNKFGFIPGYNLGKGETPPSPVTPPTKHGADPNPKTVFRNFQIKKVSAKAGTKVLSGAKFKLFANKDDAEKCAKDPSVTDNCKGASAFGERTTKDTGLTDQVKAIVNQTFYAVETEAPDGYARSNQLTEVKIPENNADNPYMVTIENVPTSDSGNWFTLPKTGATGVIIFALAGLALVAAGTGLYLFGRKS